jgi:hypothetical protein
MTDAEDPRREDGIPLPLNLWDLMLIGLILIEAGRMIG